MLELMLEVKVNRKLLVPDSLYITNAGCLVYIAMRPFLWLDKVVGVFLIIFLLNIICHLVVGHEASRLPFKLLL